MDKLAPIEAALTSGQQALTGHDINGINEALEQLRSGKLSAEDAEPAISYLESAAQALRATAPVETGAKPTPNRLTFTQPLEP